MFLFIDVEQSDNVIIRDDDDDDPQRSTVVVGDDSQNDSVIVIEDDPQSPSTGGVDQNDDDDYYYMIIVDQQSPTSAIGGGVEQNGNVHAETEVDDPNLQHQLDNLSIFDLRGRQQDVSLTLILWFLLGTINCQQTNVKFICLLMLHCFSCKETF